PGHALTLFQGTRGARDPHSFPTRRSSDLNEKRRRAQGEAEEHAVGCAQPGDPKRRVCVREGVEDRHLPDRSQRDECAGELRLARSEEHTSELQSRENLVCRLLLEKKK